MNAVSIDTCSWMVRALIACCVTILCLALVGRRDCAVVGGVGFPVSFLVDMRLVGSLRGAPVFGIGCTLLIGGNAPGVLFPVALL